MTNYYREDQSNKKYSNQYYLPRRIGPGALPNEQVRRCYGCKEPIQFKKLTDGKGWQLLDYFTGQPHVHKDRTGGW